MMNTLACSSESAVLPSFSLKLKEVTSRKLNLLLGWLLLYYTLYTVYKVWREDWHRVLGNLSRLDIAELL